MDLKRVPYTLEYIQKLKDLIKAQYSLIHFDVIIASDNDAFDFLRQYRGELFPGVPVVFSALNDFAPSMLEGRRDITGIAENTDYAGTVELALKLYPRTRTVVTVVDNTTTGRAHRSVVEKIVPRFTGRVRFEFFSYGDYTRGEFLQKLSALSPDSVVLLLHHFMDKTGTSFSTL